MLFLVKDIEKSIYEKHNFYFPESIASGLLQGAVLHGVTWDTRLDCCYAAGMGYTQWIKTGSTVWVDLSDIYEALINDLETHQLLSFTGQ